MERTIDIDKVTLAVLAGGAGKRMGVPKQNLQIVGKPILEYLLDKIAWPGPTLLITTPGREHPPGFDRFDVEAVDAVADQGPLRGVLTALQNMNTDWAVITTVDMPGVAIDQLCWLLSSAAGHGLMLQRDGNGESGIEPFPFVCRKDSASIIEQRLNENRRSVHSLAEIQGFSVKPAPPEWPASIWTNLNFPADYQAFMRQVQP